MEKAKNILKEKKIRPTYQRIRILKLLERDKTHPSADDIYGMLQSSIPTLSKTTVYNTLNYFVKKGLALPIIITSGETRFDGCIVPHHHFYCEKCKKIIDLNITCTHSKKGVVSGHMVRELHGYFKGVCRDCAKI